MKKKAMDRKIMAIVIAAVLIAAVVIIVLLIPDKEKVKEADEIEILESGLIYDYSTKTVHTDNYDIGEIVTMYLLTGPVTTVQTEEGYEYDVSIDKQLLDDKGNVVVNVVNAQILQGVEVEEYDSLYYVDFTYTLDLEPGKYTLRFVVNNNKAEEKTIVEKEFTLNNVDLIMTTPLVGIQRGDSFDYTGSNFYIAGQNFEVYYEVHDFGTLNGEAHITTDFKLENLNTGAIVFDMPNYFEDKKELSSYRRVIPINTSTLERGYYRLSITSKDNVNNNQNTKEATFEVI